MRYVFAFFFLACLLGCMDPGNLKLIDNVPTSLDEISGLQLVKLEGFDKPFLAAINDSGNSASLYLYQDNSRIHSITIQGVKNKDWEDVTVIKDGSGHATDIIIADIGDNSQSRDDIQLIKVPLPKDGIMPESISGTTYNMTYKNGKSRNAEAVIYRNDSVFVFSKESEKGYDFFSKVFAARLGDKELKKQYEIGIENLPNKQKVTAADINDVGQVALLSRRYVFTYPFNQLKKSLVVPKVYDLKHSSQKEGLTYINDSTLYLADELKKGTGGNMYQFTLRDSFLKLATKK
ncbi:hypothetical protein [Nonlabens ponticola]|uniref:Esterase-like activity of phytase family protein n=1 Tax=Nonlabens ponticola TaxID=2496866 RepID=A0A3S9MYX8_9FLAO|nr:hypothetical protein [Nonlabens ponticola]AZQ44263.1 hypothetical protein EJ995_08440 [Nonlabens ponticola]